MEKTRWHLLLVEDDDDEYLLMQDLIRRCRSADITMDWETSYETGLTALKEHVYDCGIFDYRLGEGTGLDILKAMADMEDQPPVIILTGLEDHDTDLAAMELGASDYLCKDGLNSQLLERSIRYSIERKRIEKELRRSLQQLAEAQQVAQIGSWEWYPDTDLMAWSEVLYRIFCIPRSEEPMTFKRFLAAVHMDEATQVKQTFEQAVESQAPFNLDCLISVNEAEERVINIRGQAGIDEQTPSGRLLGTIQDITDRKQLEAQFLQAQKMEIVGRLAGGVAHDFNNMLTVITGYAEILRLKLQEEHNEDVLDMLNDIKYAGESATSLTRQLLWFSRKQPVQPSRQKINILFTDIRKILQRLIGEDVDLVIKTASDIRDVNIDRGQLEQVILNLVINARDAMPEGGRITIQTADVCISKTLKTPYNSELPPGTYVMISVEDTGCGMSETLIKQIFEPFFTTKVPDKGTGLGLATVLEIIEGYNGAILVDSEVSKGTSFRIYLPAIRPYSRPDSAEDTPVSWPQGKETLLLVEDEKPVRDIMSRILSSRGYLVLGAEDGLEACEVVKDIPPENIHLIVTDMIMPKLGGMDMIIRLREMNYQAPVVCMTGYTDDDVLDRARSLSDVSVLMKPITPSVLANRVREVLDLRIEKRGHDEENTYC